MAARKSIIVRNKDTGAVVNRYKSMEAARAHVASFPNDYIARIKKARAALAKAAGEKP